MKSETLLGLNGDHANISVDDPNSTARTYTHSTTQDLRDNAPESRFITYSEEPGQMIVRSADLVFDALFALAMDEMRQNSVEEISDKKFNNDSPVPCHCFETGAKWHYVWTRDTSYSVNLALALIDPIRSMNSLNFKLSDRRVKAGDNVQEGPEIVQDTGSGGSWPVSTDRVVWAMGAYEVLKYLDGDERAEFLDNAYKAIVTAIENDRKAVYDVRDGLYRGEQSFLDWREQTYASWMKDDLVHIGMSKALSTNAVHYAILDIASRLAEEKGDVERQARYRGRANDLKHAINKKFWLDTEGLYSSMTTTELDQAPLKKFDMLGEALAILTGIADTDKAISIMARYPHSEAGVPVIWPQQPDIPIYHNRAIWPFVTAYSLRAARLVNNDAVVDHNVESLIRAAALNLSNMENLEWVTGLPSLFDESHPDLFGPVVNSQRQLWSVAGYLSMVLDVVFGREATQEGIRFHPFITKNMRNGRFKEGNRLNLRNVSYKGKMIDVTVALPAKDNPQSGGYYQVAGVTLNGRMVSHDAFFTPADLKPENQIVISLKEKGAALSTITIVAVDDAKDLTNRDIFAPKEPKLTEISEENGRLTLKFDRNGETDVTFNIYRNGESVASKVTGTSWTDKDSGNFGSQTFCYAVESECIRSGNCSHHSRPLGCWTDGTVQEISVTAEKFVSSTEITSVDEHGRLHFSRWGGTDEQLQITDFIPARSGTYLINLVYANAAGSVETGITAAVKWIEVIDSATDEVVGSGVVLMPHLPKWDIWADSSVLPVSLEGGNTYHVIIKDFYNMSYLAHFAMYTGGKGGHAGPYNYTNIAGVKFRSLGVSVP